MLPNINIIKGSKKSSKTKEPIKLSESPSFISMSTQISLDPKKSSSHSIKSNTPKLSSIIEIKIITPKDSSTENYEIQLNNSSKISENKNSKFQTGKWTKEEHEKFIEGILMYGNEYKKVQEIIKTRSSDQARSHAQKFFLKIKKAIENIENNSELKQNEKSKKIDDIITEIIPNKTAKNLTQNQKDKLLSAISYNIKCKENYSFCPELGPDLDEIDDLSYNCFNNDISFTSKNRKNSLDLSIFNDDDDDICQPKNMYISKKRKLSKKKENIGNLLNLKKIESHRPSVDLSFNKLNGKENEEFVFESIINQENKENIVKNSSNCSSTNDASPNSQEEKGKSKYIINNVINVTNNYIKPKDIMDEFNKEIINNTNNFLHDLFFNEKNDIINNDKNEQNCFKDYHSQENYRNQFNQIFNDFNKYNYNDNNDFNEYENKNENEDENNNKISDPFHLNFNGFSNENSSNNDIERQVSFHENDFLKLPGNI